MEYLRSGAMTLFRREGVTSPGVFLRRMAKEIPAIADGSKESSDDHSLIRRSSTLVLP